MTSDRGIPPEKIVQAADRSGFSVSGAQLHRWRSQGLIPRPKVRGLGRGRGATSFYPAGTDLQVVSLCELLKKDRRLDLAAMALFFQGYPVSVELLKRILMETADRRDKETSGLVTDTGLTSNGVDVLDKIVLGRLKSKPLAQARNRLRRSKFESFIRLLIFVAAGRSPDFLEDGDGAVADSMVLKRGLGIEAALQTWMKVDDGDLQSAINNLAAHFNSAALRSTITESGDAALNTGRDELLIVWQALMDMKACFLLLDKRDALGLRALPEIDFTQSTPMAPAMLLVWLHLKQLPEVAETLPKVIASAAMVSNLRNLLDNHPKLAHRLIKPLGVMLGLVGGLLGSA